MMTDSLQREEAFARMEEIALRSAYAHGKALTDFSFTLPRHDDVIVRHDGSLAFRADTDESGYTPEEEALYAAAFPASLLFSPTLPSSFLAHTEVIASAHTADIEEIARGLVRERVTLTTAALHAFAASSFYAHEALLATLHDIFHLDNPGFATHLVHTSYPAFVHALEALIAASRRFGHPAFVQTLTSGAQDQHHELLLTGLASGYDAPFFTAQLSLFS